MSWHSLPKRVGREKALWPCRSPSLPGSEVLGSLYSTWTRRAPPEIGISGEDAPSTGWHDRAEPASGGTREAPVDGLRSRLDRHAGLRRPCRDREPARSGSLPHPGPAEHCRHRGDHPDGAQPHETRAPFAFVLTQCPSGPTPRASDAYRALQLDGVVAGTAVAMRVDHIDALAHGLGVTERNPTGKAAAEISRSPAVGVEQDAIEMEPGRECPRRLSVDLGRRG